MGGLAYLALIFAVLVMSMVAANSVQLGTVHAQRAQEEELLFVGAEISSALARYARSSPSGSPRAPKTLDELLQDPRHPGTVRHLRRRYADPLAPNGEWGLVRDPQGLIIGVHSQSTRTPLREAGPPGNLPTNGQAWQTYREWIFWGPVARPGGAARQPAPQR
jgi:type II secretory pathway pseudopilin PulG